MTAERARVLILDLALERPFYRPTEHWRRFLGNAESASVSVVDGEPVPDLHGFTHVIVTGSEASIVEPRPWFAPAEEAVRQAAAVGLPLLGSCFGHQLIVRALHGPAHVRRAARPELGWIPVEVLPGEPSLLGEPGREIHLLNLHFDEVCDLPPTARVLARSADCEAQILRLGDAPIWGVQAHPEMTIAEGIAFLEKLARERPAVAELVARALRDGPREDGFCGHLIAFFLAQGRR